MSNELIAEIVPNPDGLTISFTVTGKLETRLREMFNDIRDDESISKSMGIVLNIAMDSIDLIQKHKSKLY